MTPIESSHVLDQLFFLINNGKNSEALKELSALEGKFSPDSVNKINDLKKALALSISNETPSSSVSLCTRVTPIISTSSQKDIMPTTLAGFGCAFTPKIISSSPEGELELSKKSGMANDFDLIKSFIKTSPYEKRYFPIIDILQGSITLSAVCYLSPSEHLVFQNSFLKGLRDSRTTGSFKSLIVVLKNLITILEKKTKTEPLISEKDSKKQKKLKHKEKSVVSDDDYYITRKKSFPAHLKTICVLLDIKNPELLMSMAYGFLNRNPLTMDTLSISFMQEKENLSLASFQSIHQLSCTLSIAHQSCVNAITEFNETEGLIKKGYSSLNVNEILINKGTSKKFNFLLLKNYLTFSSHTLQECIEYRLKIHNAYSSLKYIYLPILQSPEFLSLLSEDKITTKHIELFESNKDLFDNFVKDVEGFQKWVVMNCQTMRNKIICVRDFDIFIRTVNLQKLEEDTKKIIHSVSKFNIYLTKEINQFAENCKKSDAEALSKILLILKDPLIKSYRDEISRMLLMFDQFETFTSELFNLPLKTCANFAKFRRSENLKSDESILFTLEELSDLIKYREIELPNGLVVKTDKILSEISDTKDKISLDMIKDKLKKQKEKLTVLKATSQDRSIIKTLLTIDCLGVNDVYYRKLLDKLPKIITSSHSLALESESKEVSSLSLQKKELTVSSKPILAPEPFSIHKHIESIENELFPQIQLLKKKFTSKGSSEAVINMENHLKSLLAIMERFYEQISSLDNKKHLFSTLVNSVSEGSLILEQLLLAIDLHLHPVKDQSDLKERFTHKLSKLLEKGETAFQCLNYGEMSFISGIDGGELRSRDIAYFVGEIDLDHPLTLAKNLLSQAFENCHFKDHVDVSPIIDQWTNLYKNLLGIVFKLCSRFTLRKKEIYDSTEQAKKMKKLNDHLKFFKDQLKLSETKKSPKKATLDLYETKSETSFSKTQAILKEIDVIRKLLPILQKEDLSSCCEITIVNIRDNLLCRLQSEIEYQPILQPREVHLHLATILQLNQFIAEEILEVILTIRNQHTDQHNDHNLMSMVLASGKRQEDFSESEIAFLKYGKKVRVMARYQATYSPEHKSTSSDAPSKSNKLHKKIKDSAKLSLRKIVISSSSDGFSIVPSESTRQFFEMQRQALDDVATLCSFLEKIAADG